MSSLDGQLAFVKYYARRNEDLHQYAGAHPSTATLKVKHCQHRKQLAKKIKSYGGRSGVRAIGHFPKEDDKDAQQVVDGEDPGKRSLEVGVRAWKLINLWPMQR